MAFVHEHGISSIEKRVKSADLPNIPYFTEEEQKIFIKNHPIVKGATVNTLAQVQAGFIQQGIPLAIPKKSSYDEKWTYQQLEAFAMQGVQVLQNLSEEGIPQFPYIYDSKGRSKATSAGAGATYYERFLTTEKPDPRIYTGSTIGTGFKRGQAYQPSVTEEVTVEAEPGITVDSIVSGITQAVTVQEAAAESSPSTWVTLSQETKTIINNFPNAIKKSTFQNNIDWLLQGLIDEDTFLRAYYYDLEIGAITFPEEPAPEQKETWWVTKPSGIIEQITVTPSGKRKLESIGWKFSKEKPYEPDLTTSTSMVTQKLDYFDIIDGRANGQLTFRATSDFNPYYYGKELVTYLQLVNKQGIVIAEKKANVLRFTQTEQDETIHYDEAVGDLEIVYAISTVETHDKRSMAENYPFKIKKDAPPEEEELPRTDFLAKIGGVLAGSIAIALLLPKRIGK